MDTSSVWITPKIPVAELDGQTIEVDIATADKNRSGDEGHGIGVIRIQPHPSTTGLVCLWVMFPPPVLGPEEIALDQIEVNHIQPHPDPAKARYLCRAHYAID
jgi:hypothetical protein